MSTWIKDTTFKKRQEIKDYIYGLIRYEIHKGEDNDKRLEVLSKIYYDLLYVEDLRDSSGWKKKVKDKDDLVQALDKVQSLTAELEKAKSDMTALLGINDKMTKKDIIELVSGIKKEVG